MVFMHSDKEGEDWDLRQKQRDKGKAIQ